MSARPAEIVLFNPWRAALPAIVVVILAIGLLYRDTAAAMVSIWWRSETFTHAFLVPPIVLWLIWRQREAISRLTPRPSPWVLALLAGAALLWLVADLSVVNAATQLALVSMLVLAVPAVLGWQVAYAMLFPLLFLFFAVPIGEFMVPPMMEWTADFVVLALQLTGIPVYREGLWFVIPSGQWSVIDACSGVRYLIASFMVGSLFAYLNYRSPVRRATFMVVSLLLPIVANWLRAYIIVMLGHLSGNTIAVGVDHILYGWIFFGIVIFALFAVGMRWSEPDEPTAGAATRPQARAAAGGGGKAGVVAAGAAVLAVAVAPHAVLWKLEDAERGVAAAKLAAPAGWGADVPQPAWGPKWNGPEDTLHREFEGEGGGVGVYVAYYRRQHDDSKLVSSVNGVVDLNERVWKVVGAASRTIAAPSGPVTLRETRVLGPESAAVGAVRPHLVTLRAYWIDGRFVAGDAAAKLHNAASRLQGRGDDGAVVVIHASRATFEEAASATEKFARDNLPAIAAMLQKTRDAR
jgi:exosortase A